MGASTAERQWACKSETPAAPFLITAPRTQMCRDPLRVIPIRIVFSLKKPVFLILAAAPLLATVVDYAAEGKLWWAHIQFLADDKLQGRNVGTPEFLQAVEYVSGQFQKLGLK